MNKLIEQLNNFVYDSEVDFFDINRAEAQAFINEIENFENKFIEFEDKVDKLEFVIKKIKEYMDKNQIEEVYLDCKLYETKVYKDILEILKESE